MCDTSEARLKHMRSLYSDIEGVTDFGHLLNGVGLDAVVVATPVKYHYSLAKASLLAGKHTLIEKPMASSSAECEELIEIAQRNGLVPMVGHTHIHNHEWSHRYRVGQRFPYGRQDGDPVQRQRYACHRNGQRRQPV